MAAPGYKFYLLVLKVSLTSERSEQGRDTFSTRRWSSYPRAAMQYPLYMTFVDCVKVYWRGHIGITLPGNDVAVE